MYLNIEIDKEGLVHSLLALDQNELLTLMIDVDLMVADVGFTEDLVKKLVKSLKSDRDDVNLPFIDWEVVV